MSMQRVSLCPPNAEMSAAIAAWHKEQTARVSTFKPTKPDIPGNWNLPGDDYTPPAPPTATQTRQKIPHEMFSTESHQKPIMTAATAVTVAALGLIGITLFTKLLK
jgi:hypothetical protein